MGNLKKLGGDHIEVVLSLQVGNRLLLFWFWVLLKSETIFLAV